MIVLNTKDVIDNYVICPCCESKIKQYDEIGMLISICPMCKKKIIWEIEKKK